MGGDTSSRGGAANHGGSDNEGGGDSSGGGEYDGVGGVGGASNDGGDGGSVPQSPLDVTWNAPGPLCPQQTIRVIVHVQGASGPVEWRLLDPSGEFRLQNATDDHAELIGTPDRPGTYPLTIQVTSNGDQAARSFGLTVDDPATGDCPIIRYAGSSATPPAPCLATPYEAAFTVDGGRGDYDWQVLELPPGLDFDASAHTVSGTPEASGPLTLVVKDEDGRKNLQTFWLEARDSCWLAYVAGDELRLLDPVTNVRRSFANASTDERALDFRFSNDGQFLAARVDDDRGDAHLVIREAPDWKERAVTFGTNVIDYAWSPAAPVLAVAFSDADGTWLGGVDCSHPVAANDAGAPQAGGMLAASAAPFVSQLTWFGQDLLVYFGDALLAKGAVSLYYASVGESAIAPSRAAPTIFYPPDSVLWPAGDGLFVSCANGLDHYGLAAGSHGDAPLAALGLAVPAPTGHYAAVADGSTLALFTLNASTTSLDVPFATLSECDRLLSWGENEGNERLACLTESAGDYDVQIADLDENAARFSTKRIKGSYDYSLGLGFEQKRAFSPSGDWFVFTTENNLYAASLHDEAPYVFRSGPIWQPQPAGCDAARVDLVFSPDERFVVAHRGCLAFIYSLEDPDAEGLTLGGSDSLLANAPACSETFSGDSTHWCGDARTHASIGWSRDSRFVAFATATRRLLVEDLSTSEDITPSEVDSDCSEACAFTFQP